MATKRTVIAPHKGDKRYIRRAADGELTEKQVDVGKSLAADRRSHSKTIAPKGQGDRGDQKAFQALPVIQQLWAASTFYSRSVRHFRCSDRK